jgi:hypothetical protein
MLYNTHSADVINKHISKLKPIPYNQFRWWRKFDTKTKPFPHKATLLERIRNEEFEFSQYFWQAQHCEQTLNIKFLEYKGDLQKLLENHGVEFTRRKRLWEDFERDEQEKLKSLQTYFLKEFEITKEEYTQEIEQFGDTLENLYIYIRKSYETKTKSINKRGRKPKQI